MAESVQRRFPPHVFPWIVLGGMYLAIAAGMSTAASVPPSPGSNQSIVRNGTPLDILPALEDISVNGTQAVPYLSIEEQILQDAIAHSGSATFDSTIYQHVYAYNTSRANYQYLVNNSADNTRTISYSPDYIGLPEGRYTRVADQIVLDGSLLVVKSPQEKNPCSQSYSPW